MWNAKKHPTAKQHQRATGGWSVRWLLSHLFCSIIALYLGSLYGGSLACPGLQVPSGNGRPPTERRQEGNEVVENKSISELFTGMCRVKRDDFLNAFDFGIPWESNQGDVLLLFPTADSEPTTHSRNGQQSGTVGIIPSVEDAVEHCDVLKTVTIDPAAAQKTCLAIVGQHDSYHVQKWVRNRRKNQWQSVSRYGGTQASLLNPPKPISTRESMQLLQLYLSIQDAVLEELRPIAKQVAAASGTVVVMVCNAGHAELLLNFICAARAVGVDLSSFLLFATDIETKLLADQLQLTAYYNNKLFSAIPNGDATIEYGTKPYARVMISKVYCVHLISSLGHDLLFQDVDLVPYRKDYIEHFIGAAKAFSQFDLYFQYDHSMAPRYLPWSANSGFYYARSNVKTRYFFSVLLRLGDLVLQSKSHQAVMAALLSEHASLFGLRAKTMHEEARNYPVGYHFHRDRPFMKDMIDGKLHPYVFHMNWNSDKETKRKFNEQLGDWFVKDECTGKPVDELTRSSQSDRGACCVAKPVVVCHFRDKPSKIRCDESPLIEDKTSFW